MPLTFISAIFFFAAKHLYGNIDELEFTFGDLAEDIIKDDSDCPIVIVLGIMGSQLYSSPLKYGLV